MASHSILLKSNFLYVKGINSTSWAQHNSVNPFMPWGNSSGIVFSFYCGISVLYICYNIDMSRLYKDYPDSPSINHAISSLCVCVCVHHVLVRTQLDLSVAVNVYFEKTKYFPYLFFIRILNLIKQPVIKCIFEGLICRLLNPFPVLCSRIIYTFLLTTTAP